MAIPNETLQPSLTQVEDAMRETIPAVADVTEPRAAGNLVDVKAAAETTLETAAASVAESAETMKNAIAPVAEQVTEKAAESAKGLGGLFQGFNQKNQKKRVSQFTSASSFEKKPLRLLQKRLRSRQLRKTSERKISQPVSQFTCGSSFEKKLLQTLKNS